MALIIRFSRIGRRGERKNRIVVREQRSKRDGRPVDTLGFYEKRSKNSETKTIDRKKLDYWISHGAKVTAAVKKIL